MTDCSQNTGSSGNRTDSPQSSSSCSLSMQSCSLADSCTAGLTSKNWYWGRVEKEAVTKLMENQRDGTFLVRDASTKGDFTLTLKVSRVNKLIKVIVLQGKCGFTADSLDFETVVELIDFYRRRSLKEFNEKLDTCLLYPLSKPKSPKFDLPAENPKMVFHIAKCRLEGLFAEYERVSKRYDQLFIQKASLAEESRKKRLTLSAYSDAIELYQQKCDILKGTNLEELPKGKELVKSNLQLQNNRIEDIQKAKGLMTNALNNLEKTIGRIDEELEELKPRLISLHGKREECKEDLVSKHNISQLLLEKCLKEVGYLLDCEPINLSSCLLDLPMEWDPSGWLTTQPKKETTIRIIISAQEIQKPERKDGIFLIRPSQSRAGCYALAISMGGQVHSCLIEYREPKNCMAGVDYCGFAFLNTNMFFSTLVDFVRYYAKVSLKEHNAQLDTCLVTPALLAFG